MNVLDRRLFLSMTGMAVLAVAGGRGEAFAPRPPGGFVMWHSPGCGCCLEWAKRVEAAFGRKLPIIEVADIAAVKRARGVPADLASCHTALIRGYAVEGHVPPADIQRLIASGSRVVKGLAVPGMPAGSPGMDVGHDHRQPYKVYAFGAGGQRSVFAAHG